MTTPRLKETSEPARGTPEPPCPAPPRPPAPALMPVLPPEFGGPTGPEPTRYGDWEHKGRCSDF